MKIVQGIALIISVMMMGNCYAGKGRHKHHRQYDNYHSYHHWIEDRQYQQRQTIEEALYQGLLSDRELKKLNRQQRKIAHMICDFEQDRYFSKWERRKIDKQFNYAEQKIYAYIENRTYARSPSPGHQHGYYTGPARNNFVYRSDSFAGNDFRGGVYVQW